MDLLDLFATAEGNRAALEARYSALRAGKEPGSASQLDAFADYVGRHGLVSINMRPWVLSNLLVEDAYQNMYEFASEQSAVSGRDADEVLREKLGSLYGKRLAFDGAFVDGRRFRYGALNLGGTGMTCYGQFCVVLKPLFHAGHAMAYLVGDSLRTCLDSAGALIRAVVEQQTAPHSHRQFLAALKHANDLPSRSESDWPALVCCNSEFIEVIFLREVKTDSIGEVRIGQPEYQTLWDLAFADFARELGAGESALANDFVQILRAAERRGINIRRVK
jgi:hypothetical protein